MSSDALLKWRDEFPVLARSNYQISNSLGAMPARAERALGEYASTWASRGVRAWAETWWDMPRRFADRLGLVLDAPQGSVSMHLNVTSASATVVSCFDFTGPRNKIVYEDLTFPSLHYLYSSLPAGARVVTVASEDGITVPTEKLLDAIDEETLLVPITHVLFRSAYIQNVEAIVAKAHRVGAHVVLDTYQSAGTLDFSLARLGVDFAVGGTLKWLCGGPGVAFLYVRPDLAPRLKPRFTGWVAHPEPFAFEVAAMRYSEGSYRFMNGTPNIPGLYAAREGIEVLLDIGTPAVRQKSMAQTARLIALARAQGFKVTAPERAEERGGTVAIDVANGHAVARELLARDVVVDYRPKAGIRLSPHFYTRDEELELAVAAIREILDTRAYERHLETRSVVT